MPGAKAKKLMSPKSSMGRGRQLPQASERILARLPHLVFYFDAARHRSKFRIALQLDPVVNDARRRWQRTRRDLKRSNDSGNCSHSPPHYSNVRFGAVAEYMIASARSSSGHVIGSGAPPESGDSCSPRDAPGGY